MQTHGPLHLDLQHQQAGSKPQQPSPSLWPHAVRDARWEFVALVPLFDPPRHDTGDTVARCLEKGIMVKMITGDHLDIGQETARQLGMGYHMHTSHHLTQVRGMGSLGSFWLCGPFQGCVLLHAGGSGGR